MILPQQMLSMDDKLKRHEITGKNNIEETIDFYIQSCSWSNYTNEIVSLYRAVEGFINEQEYKSVHNPYNKQKDDTTLYQFNAVLKDYNILKGIVNLLMGEFGRRTHDYIVIDFSEEQEFTYKQALNIVIKKYYAQAVANTLKSMEFDLGQQYEELPSLEEYIKNFKDSYSETNVISGQEILDYIKFNCDLDNKYIDLFYDWIITGGFYTYKKVNHDDVYFETVPRYELYHPLEKHSRFIEDYSYAVRRQILPVYKVVDLFKGRIEKDIIEALERHIQSGMNLTFSDVQMTGRNGFIRLPTTYTNNTNFNIVNTASNGVELYHVVYKSWRPYQILKYIDPILGIEAIKDVDEKYQLQPELGDISLELQWENIVMQGYKVLGFYLDCNVLEENRADLNQEGLQKLPYNGIVERSISNEVQSIIKDGLNYQRSINLLKYQLEKLINKYKDKIIVMPYGLVPRKKGIDTKTQMYHADSTSILWIDETAPNAALAGQMIKVLDMSLGTYIKDTIELIKYVKSEYWDAIGMNAQRYSDINQNAGKAVTEQAIVRSAVITNELFRQFEMVITRDYQGLLDISKLAFIEGKKAKYIRNDASVGLINLNQDNIIRHCSSSYNVFVKPSGEMTEAIQAMRAQAVNLIQNSPNTSVLGALYKTNSPAKLEKLLRDIDDNQKQYEQLLQKQKDEALQKLEDTKLATQKAKNEIEMYKADKAYEATVESASIRSDNNSRNEPRPANEIEVLLATHKIQHDNETLAVEKNKIKNDNKDKK